LKQTFGRTEAKNYYSPIEPAVVLAAVKDVARR
jgi:hypothetical protein